MIRAIHNGANNYENCIHYDRKELGIEHDKINEKNNELGYILDKVNSMNEEKLGQVENLKSVVSTVLNSINQMNAGS